MSSPTSGRAWASTPSSPGSGATSSSSPDAAPAPGRTGRDGQLRLAFERRDGRTVLAARRFTLPLQALEPMDLEGDGDATLLLLNPTGGILAGDRLESDIALGPGSRVCLSTPSAARVHRSPGPPAVQRVTIDLGPGAVLEWMPDHLIPSPGARLQQASEITLARGSTLLHLDAWAVGRQARGERWGFDRLDAALLARDEAGPLLRERIVLSGASGWDGLGGTEGLGYVATFAAVRPGHRAGPAGWHDLARLLQEDLARVGVECRAGVSELARDGVLARLLCPGAPALQACVEALWARCRRELLGRAPLRLRKL